MDKPVDPVAVGEIGRHPNRSSGASPTRAEIKHSPRILSLDGGGVRGLSSLLILREIMEEIRRRTKATIAPLTSSAAPARSIDGCINEYIDLSQKVFDVDAVLRGVIPVGDDQCRFDYKKLEREIKGIVLKRLGDEKAQMAENDSITKTIPTFVVVTKGLNAGGPPTLFRSYECDGHNADTCAIWEAARATSAAPTFFKPITIESPLPKATYVDGGLQNNNPAELARAEAQKIWPNAKRFCIVSIGTGRVKAIQVASSSKTSDLSKGRKMLKWIPGLTTATRVPSGVISANNIAKACVDLVTNSEPVHQRLFKESNSSDPERQFPYHRFNVERDMQDIGLQEWNKVEEMASHTSVYVEEGEGILKRNKCVVDLMDPPDIERIKEASNVPKQFMVDHQRNPHFTGRDDLLAGLREKLLDAKPKQFNHRVAIYGLGGVGKTQIAIEYAYRYGKEYNSIFWVSAADQAALLSGFERIAKLTICSTTLNQKPETIAKAVLAWLRQEKGWLLVMDNVDDVSVAEGYLPAMGTNGHTLITTRNSDCLQFQAEGIEIPVLEKYEAINLFYLRSDIQNIETSSADYFHISNIVDELGCHALAIEQASAFIRCSRMDVSKFLPIYKASRTDLLKRKSPGIGQYKVSVYASVQLSFGKVEKMKYGEQAMKLLHLLAFLNPDGILMEFLEGGEGLGEELQKLIANDLVFHEALSLLQQFSLIRRSKSMNALVIHRIIQSVTRDELSESMRATYQNIVLELCSKTVPDRSHPTYLKFKRLQSQIVEPVFELFSTWTPETRSLFSRIGKLLLDDGKLKDAQRFFQADIDHCIKLLGEEHPSTLTSMNNLASTYRRQGRLQEAADLEEKVLEAEKRILGEEHPSTLTSMGNLASIYSDQGRLQEAVDLEEKVLEAQRRVLEEDHPDTLTSMNNLAQFYKSQGRMHEAVTLMQQAVNGQEQRLGPDHNRTRGSKEALARWLGLLPW